MAGELVPAYLLPHFYLFSTLSTDKKKERKNSKGKKHLEKNTFPYFLVERLQKCQFIKMFFRGDFLRAFLKPIKHF